MLKCYYQGLISFADLNSCDQLNAKAYQQIEHELFCQPPAIKADAIKTYLSSLSYPLYFLDFETFQPAIPLYDDTKPFEQIPFQYSLHIINEEGGVMEVDVALPDNLPWLTRVGSAVKVRLPTCTEETIELPLVILQ